MEGIIGNTQSNLERAFQSEVMVAGVEYLRMLQEVKEDGEEIAALVFSQARDIEEGHARLYKRALDHWIAQKETEFYVAWCAGMLGWTDTGELSSKRSTQNKI